MFAEIDVTSHAARVAYVAAQEVMALLAADEEGNAPLFLPPPDPDLMEAHVLAMALFVGSTEFESGETLWRQFRPAGAAWEDVSKAERLALDVFTGTCRAMTARLQLLAACERLEQPPANPAIKLEDSIFAPEKGMGEMETYAAEAAKAIAAYDEAMRRDYIKAMAEAAVAEARAEDGTGQSHIQSAMDAAIAAGQIFVGKPVAEAEAAEDAAAALTPVPNKPRPKGRKAAKADTEAAKQGG